MKLTRKIKLLIVGGDNISSIENFYYKYVLKLNVNVKLFPAQGIFYNYYQKNVTNKIIYRIGLSTITYNIQKQFKNIVASFQPDVIWVFKGMEIFPQSLKWAKNKNIKLVNYNPDNPFVFSGKGSGNSNVKISIPLFDLHLTYNTEVKKEMELVYKIPTEILPFGFEITDLLFNKCSMQQEVNKVCFLGNPDIYRGTFLQKLADKGIELDVYGNHWQKFVNHRNIKIFAPVYGDYFWLTLRKYRIQLNLMRPHNPDTHNMRSFEVPGVGGIQLAPDTTDHRTYFEPGKEIFLYTDVETCAIQIKNILSLPVIEADKIREQARLRSLRSGYAYKSRASQALKYISALI